MSGALEIQPTPDWIRAGINELQEHPTVLAVLTAADISGEMPKGEGYRRFLTLQPGGSQGMSDADNSPIIQPVVVTRCYGATAHDAWTVWRHVHAALCPASRRSGFTRNGCYVRGIRLNGGPIGDLLDEGWPMVWTSYRWSVSEVPV